jgi:KDO2-lipid IV(A) lauroyltransferase
VNWKSFCAQGGPTRLAFYVGKYAPSPLGYAIADLTASLLARFKSDALYAAIYDNQRHVLGASVSPETIHANVRAVLRNAARSYYEIFRNLGAHRPSLQDFTPPVRLSPSSRRHLSDVRDSGRGLLLVGCHLSNFDLAAMVLAQDLWVKPQVLSFPDPPGGFQFFNALRGRMGMRITPSAPGALREALRRLSASGVVLTGVDRPLPGAEDKIIFFDAPAPLPMGYIRLALRTRCLVATVGCVQKRDHDPIGYEVIINPPMEMIVTGNRAQDVRRNVRRVLAELEDLIRRHPEQWMMFVPVW